MKDVLKISKNKIIGASILGLIFALFNVIGSGLHNSAGLSLSLRNVILVILFTVLFTCFNLLLFIILDKITFEGRKKIKPSLVFVISAVSLLAVYLVIFLGVYPGLFAFDAPTQYISYVNHNMTEHHPLLHTLILGTIIKLVSPDKDSINHGVAIYTLLQSSFCALSFAYLTTYVYKKINSIIIWIISVLFFAFYPPIVLMVFSTTKDTVFLAFFMFAMTLVCEIMEGNLNSVKKTVNENAKKEDNTKNTDNKKSNNEDAQKNGNIILIAKLILLGLCIAFMAIFRNNCIYAIPFLFIPLFIIYKKKSHIFLTLGVFIGVFLLYKYAFVPHFIANVPDGREMYSVPIQQLMKAYTDENATISDEDIETIEYLFDENGRIYVYGIADVPKYAVNMDYFKANKDTVKSMYLNVIKENPKDALTAFFELTAGFWYPPEELTMMPDGDKGYWPVGCYKPAVSNPKIPFIFNALKAFADSNTVRKPSFISWLFAPASFFWLFLIMGVYAIVKKKYKFLPVFSFTLFFYLTYFLGPVVLVRYTVYLFTIVPLYFAILGAEDKKA